MRTWWRSCARRIGRATNASDGPDRASVPARGEERRARRRRLVLALTTLLVCLASGIGAAGAAGPSSTASSGNQQSRPSSGNADGGIGGFVPRRRSLSVGGGSGLGAQGGSGPTVPAGAVAVPSLFTAKSRTYKTSLGIYTTTLYETTVNEQQSDGKWTPIEGANASATTPSTKPPGATTTASLTSAAAHDCEVASELAHDEPVQNNDGQGGL